MERPDLKSVSVVQPEGAPDQVAAGFFPHFATVRSALEAGRIGVWSWDLATNTVTWSSNMEAIHRLAPGTFDGTYAFFERDVHEEDRPRVVQAIKDALQTGKPYWVRYRVIPGQQREDCWIEASGQVIFEQGVAVRMLGICHEVTERIRLRSKKRWRSSANGRSPRPTSSGCSTTW